MITVWDRRRANPERLEPTPEPKNLTYDQILARLGPAENKPVTKGKQNASVGYQPVGPSGYHGRDHGNPTTKRPPSIDT